MRNPGQIAYDTYCKHTGWKSLVSGNELPKWENVNPEIKAAWTEAGLASIHYCKEIVVFKYPKVRAALERLVGEAERETLVKMLAYLDSMGTDEGNIADSKFAIRALLETLEDK